MIFRFNSLFKRHSHVVVLSTGNNIAGYHTDAYPVARLLEHLDIRVPTVPGNTRYTSFKVINLTTNVQYANFAKKKSFSSITMTSIANNIMFDCSYMANYFNISS